MEQVDRLPGIVVFTLGAGDVATEVLLPNRARRATVYFETNAGKVAHTGADNAAIVAAHNPVEANRYFQVFVDQNISQRGKGPTPLYIASATAGTVVRVTAEAG